jgi:putative peptidoglycan lipid II flippase
MGVALIVGIRLLDGWLGDPSAFIRTVGLLILVLGGVLLFALFVQLTGAADFRKLAALRRRRPPTPAPPDE